MYAAKPLVSDNWVGIGSVDKSARLPQQHLQQSLLIALVLDRKRIVRNVRSWVEVYRRILLLPRLKDFHAWENTYMHSWGCATLGGGSYLWI